MTNLKKIRFKKSVDLKKDTGSWSLVRNKNIRLLFLLMVGFLLCQCKGQTAKAEEVYTYENGDPNGIGKRYMGREITHVMGFQGIHWLERLER
mgnify:CR=1 FL=1